MKRTLIGLSALAGICTTALADVTVLPGGEPKPYKGAAWVGSRDEYWRLSAENDLGNTTADVILSSHDQVVFTSSSGYRPSSDSFVRGAIEAWGQHLHLVVRPDEVWFTILTQMNFFMNAHAESIRDLFVAHKGQETILVEACCSWEDVIVLFQNEIQKRVKTPWLRDWITPGFTTSTTQDGMTANVLMMGLMQTYFKYEGSVVCGLPSVTLLGEQQPVTAYPLRWPLPFPVEQFLVRETEEDAWVAEQVATGHPLDGLFPMDAKWRARYDAWRASR
jgi:hypothetical protein